jgi:hypothetical protein
MTVEPLLKSIELPAFPLLQQSARPGSAPTTFSQRVRSILADPFLDRCLAREPHLETDLVNTARRLGKQAYPDHRTTDRQSAPWIDHSARDELHRALLLIYQQHMRLPQSDLPDYQFHPVVCRVMHELETPWEHDMIRRAGASHDLSPEALPEDPAKFSSWYRDTAFGHPLYEHDLYSFVACEAERHQLEWFFRMECAGEAAFDDLVALSQVGTRGEVKLEMAANYWDEMGRGRSHAVHTHLFFKLIAGLELESYYGAHAVIDIGHAEGWLSHVIEPQVRSVPAARLGIAEGLIVRADASLDYFDYCLAYARALAA